jgi:hypothetical protein
MVLVHCTSSQCAWPLYVVILNSKHWSSSYAPDKKNATDVWTDRMTARPTLGWLLYTPPNFVFGGITRRIFVTKTYVSQNYAWSLMWSFIEIPPWAWPVKAGQDFPFLFVRRPFCAAKRNMLVIWTTRDGIYHSCKVWLKSHKYFHLWRPDKFFLFFSSGGHFVERSRMCPLCVQLGMVQITPVKFGWNFTSSLTCEGRTRIFLFWALVTILYSKA